MIIMMMTVFVNYAVFLSAVRLSLYLPQALAVASDCLLHQVTVSHAKLLETAQYGLRRLETHSSLQKSSLNIRCSVACCDLDWCHLWCLDLSTNNCLFSNLYISPGYEETNLNDAIKCYTRRSKDYAVGASIEASPEHPDYPQMNKNNLIDGYCSLLTQDECYKSVTDDDTVWFVLDLHQELSITHVVLVVQYSSYVSNIRNVEVRLGNSTVPVQGDFDSYQVLGDFFPGPPTSGQEIKFSSATPIKARFVSVQTKGPQSYLSVCHVQVY